MNLIRERRKLVATIPLATGVVLLTAACGTTRTVTVAQPAPAPQQAAPAQPTSQDTTAKLIEAVAAYLDSQATPKKDPSLDNVNKKALHDILAQAHAEQAKAKAPAPLSTGVKAAAVAPAETNTQQQDNQSRYDKMNGATDTGVTKDGIKLGSINMHGMALGNVVTEPVVRGTMATIQAVNDRGGVLGRRLSLVDCDDGPGEVSRAKSCLKKLVTQDGIFSMISGIDWATASMHDDLHQYGLPYVGSWAYSQTEWQDPYMFPTHMSMIHEAMAGAYWVRDVIKPKTYGLLCLTSPEMQLACSQVQHILDASGAKMVKKVDVAISETSLSAQVLAFRAANPEHIIHYTINPATLVKFMVEAAQQDYYPPKGVSGNHMAAEALGSFIGKWPVNRYWTNTTYRLWGPEFMAVMERYSKSNIGFTHHIVQAAYVGVNMFAEAAREVGPNLTRQRLMAALGNGQVWKTDSAMDQQFSYTPAERGGSFDDQTWSHDGAQGREFMYKYTDPNTTSKPDGSPSGWDLADQGVIRTDK
ncbi:MAG TPA: ABC transporter substrate-binding protein [Sporichthyaceae bacterium]|jgi:ABC-type branched-subunit amino acid transport system substrate-binding protein|nr:ABC transporter substrate-binding protein [Sporichthyaceae bacterium]